jgi:hypothetical protein
LKARRVGQTNCVLCVVLCVCSRHKLRVFDVASSQSCHIACVKCVVARPQCRRASRRIVSRICRCNAAPSRQLPVRDWRREVMMQWLWPPCGDHENKREIYEPCKGPSRTASLSHARVTRKPLKTEAERRWLASVTCMRGDLVDTASSQSHVLYTSFPLFANSSEYIIAGSHPQAAVRASDRAAPKRVGQVYPPFMPPN